MLAPFVKLTWGNHNEAPVFFVAMAFSVPRVNASEDAVDAPGFRVAVSSDEFLIFKHCGNRLGFVNKEPFSLPFDDLQPRVANFQPFADLSEVRFSVPVQLLVDVCLRRANLRKGAVDCSFGHGRKCPASCAAKWRTR